MLLSQAGGPLPTGGDVRNFVLTSCQHLYHSTVLTSCQYGRRKNSCRVGRWGGSGPAQVQTCGVVSRPTPGGSPAFSGESRRKERRGLRPLDPRLFIAARSHSLIFGVVVSGRIVGLLLPVYSDRFGTHFPEKHAEKYFYERQSPNQGTDMGAVLALRPGQCGTTAKTSECQRAGPKNGGAGALPRDSLRPGFL